MRQGTDSALSVSGPAAVVHIAREDGPRYDASSDISAPMAVLVAGDRDDVLRNLQEAEAALRELFPELVLALNGVPGEEFLVREAAHAMGRLSMATRVVEDRITAGPPNPASS